MEQIYKGFEYESVTLDEMMNERELRAQASRELIEKYGKTVICMTMNLIGEYKQIPLSHTCFCDYYRLVISLLPCSHSEIHCKKTGDVAFFVTDMKPFEVKTICERIEDFGGVGRLFDIDVFDMEGKKLSRNAKRKCLICENTAAECSRNRTHGVDAVRAKTQSILCDYFAKTVCEYAKDALIAEVDTTPKPGLVDRNNSGANLDMNYDMFCESAKAIAPYFGKLFVCGAMTDCLNDDRFLHTIRNIGIEAEKAMYAKTGNINTHKGAIYSIGLLCVGAGHALACGKSFKELIDAAAYVSTLLAQEISDTQTHGMQVCKLYNVKGARGEAAGGFKTSLYAFERIKNYVDDNGLDMNVAFPLVLCDIMCIMVDTNVLHRAGFKGLEYMQKEAKEISQMRMNQRVDELLEFDKELIKRNISPGGCADTLACAIFLIKAEQLFLYENRKCNNA